MTLDDLVGDVEACVKSCEHRVTAYQLTKVWPAIPDREVVLRLWFGASEGKGVLMPGQIKLRNSLLVAIGAGSVDWKLVWPGVSEVKRLIGYRDYRVEAGDSE